MIAFLATHPEVLAEFGFDSFGDLASYAAHQDRRTAHPTSNQRIVCIPDRRGDPGCVYPSKVHAVPTREPQVTR